MNEPTSPRDASSSSSSMNLPCPLLSLPPEIIDEIVSLLKSDDNSDLFSVARTCRQFHHAATPKIYARVFLGYYGVGENGKSPRRAVRILELMREPNLVRHAVFIDHVDSPLPTFTRASVERMRIRTRHDMPMLPQLAILTLALAGNGQEFAPAPPPLPPPLPLPPPGFTFERLQETLDAGMVNLYQAPVRTIRIVAGSALVIQALLEYVVRRDCVRKLWVEDVPLRALTRFLSTTPEVQRGFTTGLTHLRLRKLITTGARTMLPMGRHVPDDDCCPRFIQTIISHSPNLTSLTIELVQNISTLPEILEPLTFPALTAFQLRAQTGDVSCVPNFHLTHESIIAFLLRHPKLKAFAWPAEKFVLHQGHEHLLVPLMEHVSRRLVWFRSDCSLLRVGEHWSGRLNPSRLFLATFLKRMEMLETIKLQGDFQRKEMTAIHAAIGSSASAAKMKKYSLIRPQVEWLDEIVTAMPGLRELKLCAYSTPGLVSFYDIAVQGVQETDGSMRNNITLQQFLQPIGTLKHLQKLTIPFHTGLDMSDVVVSDIWDEYRSRHPGSRNFAAHPHYKSLAAEIDMHEPLPSSRIETLENGIQQQTIEDLDVLAAQPRNVVSHLLKQLRRAARTNGGLKELRSIRCFFILQIEANNLDINEFLVRVEQRAQGEQGGAGGAGGMVGGERVERVERLERLELAETPVLAYGWGTGLWLGDTKPLRSRAWFGGA